MDFFDENIGLRDQIEDLFCSKMYEQAMSTCWHLPTYKIQVLVLKELLTLQQKHIIPNYVTIEDMTDLMVEMGRASLREQLWQFDLEMLDDEDEKSSLSLAWRVNVSNKMNDIMLETQMTPDPSLTSSESQRCKIRTLCRRHVSALSQKAVEAHCAKLTSLTDVVLAVVPKVLRDFWVRPPLQTLAMASQELSQMSVAVTKAVLDQISNGNLKNFFFINFSRAIRNDLVHDIEESVRLLYAADILTEKIEVIAPELLRKIVNIATERIRPMFPAPIIPEPVPIPVEEDNEEWFLESAVILPEDIDTEAEAETKPTPGNSGAKLGIKMLFFQFITSLCIFAGGKVNTD
ncbi:uncharacterized protein ACB058_020826 [Synchiropus picturatus]